MTSNRVVLVLGSAKTLVDHELLNAPAYDKMLSHMSKVGTVGSSCSSY